MAIFDCIIQLYTLYNCVIGCTNNISQMARTQCCLNGGPLSSTLSQCWNSAGVCHLAWCSQARRCCLIAGVLRLAWGGGPRVVVSTAAFHARVRGSVPGFGGLKETKNVSSPSMYESQYCGEPPWPRGSVLGLRPTGLEFRTLCLEDSVISIISPYREYITMHYYLLGRLYERFWKL